MRSITIFSLTIGLLIGCGDDSEPKSATVGRVTPQELQTALAAGTAVVVDVRDSDSFAKGHVEGAVHIPVADVGTRHGELPRAKKIVTYCS